MLTATNQRKEERKQSQFPRPFAKVTTLKGKDEKVDFAALVIDVSSTGIGLVTSLALPVGSGVTIQMGDYAAIGEVTELREEFENWDWCGKVRLSVRLVEKSNWPIF